jgi:hypothetical protein
MGGHETIEPCPSVSSYRQKFMYFGLGPIRHGAARPHEIWRQTGVGAVHASTHTPLQEYPKSRRPSRTVVRSRDCGGS